MEWVGLTTDTTGLEVVRDCETLAAQFGLLQRGAIGVGHGVRRVLVRHEGDTVWLGQPRSQMSMLLSWCSRLIGIPAR